MKKQILLAAMLLSLSTTSSLAENIKNINGTVAVDVHKEMIWKNEKCESCYTTNIVAYRVKAAFMPFMLERLIKKGFHGVGPKDDTEDLNIKDTTGIILVGGNKFSPKDLEKIKPILSSNELIIGTTYVTALNVSNPVSSSNSIGDITTESLFTNVKLISANEKNKLVDQNIELTMGKDNFNINNRLLIKPNESIVTIRKIANEYVMVYTGFEKYQYPTAVEVSK
ncbi:TPA: hypothetical protein PXM39_003619 [Yersinia enterocolitica]|nr:hypothetical protein [Yersinia enterocolitica]HDL6901012.1 hypothetical protein [Yersinia enterocolitica]HDL7092118.1 hypothetical protein [Yersinia enterocolitica]HDL7101156.1 hypothetical protein [Yersinia enterocolitica]HDL7135637.1 hypothetical protein [Yersinia enterocolitica]